MEGGGEIVLGDGRYGKKSGAAGYFSWGLLQQPISLAVGVLCRASQFRPEGAWKDPYTVIARSPPEADDEAISQFEIASLRCNENSFSLLGGALKGHEELL